MKSSHQPAIKKKEISLPLSIFDELNHSIVKAEETLNRNFKQKQGLLLKSKRYELLYHKREDLVLREKILLSRKNGSISEDQKDSLIAKCDRVADLWRAQRKKLTIKRFQLGFPN